MKKNDNNPDIKDQKGKEKAPDFPRPEHFRPTPLSRFSAFATDILRTEYNDKENDKIEIAVPPYCRSHPDVIRKVCDMITTQGWDVMILGSFELGDSREVSIEGILSNMDSAQFLIVSPSTEQSGRLIPNEKGWNIREGQLVYNSKHATLREFESATGFRCFVQ